MEDTLETASASITDISSAITAVITEHFETQHQNNNTTTTTNNDTPTITQTILTPPFTPVPTIASAVATNASATNQIAIPTTADIPDLDDNDLQHDLLSNHLLPHDFTSFQPYIHPDLPRLKMVFDSEEEAYQTYARYAKACGFSIRRSRTRRKGNEVVKRVFTCHREGRTRPKRQMPATRDRLSTRTGCKAAMRVVKKEDGRWSCIAFSDDHNHELLAQTETTFLPAYRRLDPVVQGKIRKLRDAGIPTAQIYSQLSAEYSPEYGGVSLLPFKKRDISNYVTKLKVAESKAREPHGERMSPADGGITAGAAVANDENSNNDNDDGVRISPENLDADRIAAPHLSVEGQVASRIAAHLLTEGHDLTRITGLTMGQMPFSLETSAMEREILATMEQHMPSSTEENMGTTISRSMEHSLPRSLERRMRNSTSMSPHASISMDMRIPLDAMSQPPTSHSMAQHLSHPIPFHIPHSLEAHLSHSMEGHPIPPLLDRRLSSPLDPLNAMSIDIKEDEEYPFQFPTQPLLPEVSVTYTPM